MLKARKKVAIFFSEPGCHHPLSEKVPYCAYSMETGHESVGIGGSFASQVSSGIPLEIVDAENAQASERNRQNVSADESMEIGDTSGTGPSPSENNQQLSGMDKGATAGLGIGGGPGMTPSDQLSAATGLEVNVGVKPADQSQRDAAAAQSAIEHFQQEVARSLGTSRNLEVAPDSIVFPQAAGARVGETGPELVETAKRILGVNVSYGDLDISGINSSVDTSLDVSALTTPGRNVAGGMSGSMLNEPGSPSSVESNFDSSELLNTEELQQDEMTTRLSRAGPIGMAAAAAIMTGRKRKRQHIFESNPALRKRHCSKLIRKLKETIVELTARVGLQAAVVFYRPGKSDPKEDPSYKVFGASPLDSCLLNHKGQICSEMDAVLHQQAPALPKEPDMQSQSSDLHELPPVMFDGIPTPVHKMTQAQLRAFIPNMLKYSTGRGKPGWGKEEMKPVWWPEDIPWQNVRSDMRSSEKKKEVSWTEGLRRIVIACYLHHGRLDLLPEFSPEHLHQTISPETAQQIRIQLERLQQQHGGGGGGGGGSGGVAVPAVMGEGVEGNMGVAGGEMLESGSSSQLTGSGTDNQQVFTVDTGIGNCDSAGMPTLADATLAEAAAKLQQVADETGEVQYATQTVTVTERDAKALGQPVGSTTTVLLTAYPGGHSGGVESASESSQQFLSPPTTTANVPNVQVVYSASHIDTIPDTLTSSIASVPSSAQQTYSTSSSIGPITIPSIDPATMVMGGSSAGGGGGVVSGGGEASIQNVIMGQNEVATQIQGAMSGIQGSLIGHGSGPAGIQSGQQNEQSGGGRDLITGQDSTETAVATSIQESIAQSGAVGGDSIQDSIQDSIMGQGAGGGVSTGIHQGTILGQVSGQMGEPTGMQDSSQFLTASASAMMTGSSNDGTGGAQSADEVGVTSVSDIASQLINQYVANSRPVFQSTGPANNTAVPAQETVESMQTDVTSQPTAST